jgi:hypothetical protein
MTPTLAMDHPQEEDHEQLPPLPKSLKEDFDREQNAKKLITVYARGGGAQSSKGLMSYIIQ